MAGYIGSKSSVTLVDGYTEAEADAEFVTKTGDTMSGNLDVTGTVTGSTGITTGVNYGNFTPVTSGTTGARISANGNGMLRFASGGVDKMYVLDSGNVGIGTVSPSAKLDVIGGSSTDGIKITNPLSGSFYNAKLEFTRDGTSGGAKIQSERNSAGGVGMSFNYTANNTAEVNATYTKAMTIDSSGNVLVGKTSANSDVSGFEANASGFTAATRSNGTVFVMDRLVSDGEIISFRKDNNAIGVIGVVASNNLYIGSTSPDHTGIGFGTNEWTPMRPAGTNSDNAINLGGSTRRFNDLYATNGTIQTSDRNEKQDIASLTSTEMLVAKRISALFKTFRWKDSVAEKGDNARTHTGVIAQDVQAAFTAEGLDAGNYALFISSTWWETQTEVPAVEAVAEVTDEDGNVTTEAVEAKDAYTRTDTYDTEAEAPEGATSKTRMGIRYPELLSFVAAYNEQRFASIEARLTALEA